MLPRGLRESTTPTIRGQGAVTTAPRLAKRASRAVSPSPHRSRADSSAGPLQRAGVRDGARWRMERERRRASAWAAGRIEFQRASAAALRGSTEAIRPCGDVSRQGVGGEPAASRPAARHRPLSLRTGPLGAKSPHPEAL